MNSTNALEAAREILISWKELLEANPLLLACVLRFLDTTWWHALQRKTPSSGNASYLWPARKSCRFQCTTRLMWWWKAFASPTLARLCKARLSLFFRRLHIVIRDMGNHLQLHGLEVPVGHSPSAGLDLSLSTSSSPTQKTRRTRELLLVLTWRRTESLPSENARVVWRCM